MFKVKFKEDTSVAPFIEINIAGVGIKTALIDTGSEITLLDSVLKDLPEIRVIEGRIWTLDGLGGTVSKSDGNSFDLPVYVKDTKEHTQTIPIKGILLDMKDMKETMKRSCPSGDVVMIIGSDTLKANKAKINFHTKQITFNNEA